MAVLQACVNSGVRHILSTTYFLSQLCSILQKLEITFVGHPTPRLQDPKPHANRQGLAGQATRPLVQLAHSMRASLCGLPPALSCLLCTQYHALAKNAFIFFRPD
jgi:hypothetical protein